MRIKRLNDIEDDVDALIRGIVDYTKIKQERLITSDSKSTDKLRPEKQQKLANGNETKNKCMQISSDKLKKLNPIRLKLATKHQEKINNLVKIKKSNK